MLQSVERGRERETKLGLLNLKLRNEIYLPVNECKCIPWSLNIVLSDHIGFETKRNQRNGRKTFLGGREKKCQRLGSEEEYLNQLLTVTFPFISIPPLSWEWKDYGLDRENEWMNEWLKQKVLSLHTLQSILFISIFFLHFE